MTGIYAISPDRTPDIRIIGRILKKHRIQIFQYRRKSADRATRYQEALKLKALCARHHTAFIINDDVELCRKINADGVHLGAKDMKIQTARMMLGDQKIIGASCYDRLDFAKTAQWASADYAAFGALFASPTKPEAKHCPLSIIRRAKQNLNIPVVGIGGIDFENQQKVFAAGADAVCMISALFEKTV